jgi:hypothetical protein
VPGLPEKRPQVDIDRLRSCVLSFNVLMSFSSNAEKGIYIAPLVCASQVPSLLKQVLQRGVGQVYNDLL